MISDSFTIKPFSVLHVNTPAWRRRRIDWSKEGFDDTEGRENAQTSFFPMSSGSEYISVFDPVLAECVYRWFCKEGGTVLDPFCGGATRGYVASMLGMRYTGIDIRREQIDADIRQCSQFKGKVRYICGDSEEEVKSLGMFDLLFSCPPYYDLEVYSDNKEDLSNKPTYEEFLSKYKEIIKSCCSHINIGGFAVFVVGEIRDRNGYCRGFVKDTTDAFLDSGMRLWNEIILDQPSEDAAVRVGMFKSTGKVVKTHQNVLVFAKRVNEKDKIARQLDRFISRTKSETERAKLMEMYARMSN